jgi:hypothetical protein
MLQKTQSSCVTKFRSSCKKNQSGECGLGRSVVVVRQGEQQWTDIRERALAWRMVPGAA